MESLVKFTGIRIDHLAYIRGVHHKAPLFQKYTLGAQLLDRAHFVADEQDRTIFPSSLTRFPLLVTVDG
jgi:hypothetical protein